MGFTRVSPGGSSRSATRSTTPITRRRPSSQITRAPGRTLAAMAAGTA